MDLVITSGDGRQTIGRPFEMGYPLGSATHYPNAKPLKDWREM
jgi:hypothetical protein